MSVRLNVSGLVGGPRGLLKGIDLQVQAGELVAVLGPSGAGKTTLLNLMAGLQTPMRGTIRIDGEVVSGEGIDLPPRKRGVGIAFQDLGLWPYLNVIEHLSLSLESQGRSTSSRDIDSMMVLERLELRSKLLAFPGELSGGERRRLALARALVVSPKVLLLDEPLTGVDGPLREQLFGVVREVHHRANSATVLVTHRLDEALALGTRLAILADGRLHQIGAVQEVYNHPSTATAARLLGFENVISSTQMGEWINLIVPLERQKEMGGRENWAIAFRADCVALTPDGIWPGTIRESRFAGPFFMTKVGIGEFEVMVRTDSALEPNAKVKLTVGEPFLIVEDW